MPAAALKFKCLHVCNSCTGRYTLLYAQWAQLQLPVCIITKDMTSVLVS